MKRTADRPPGRYARSHRELTVGRNGRRSAGAKAVQAERPGRGRQPLCAASSSCWGRGVGADARRIQPRRQIRRTGCGSALRSQWMIFPPSRHSAPLVIARLAPRDGVNRSCFRSTRPLFRLATRLRGQSSRSSVQGNQSAQDLGRRRHNTTVLILDELEYLPFLISRATRKPEKNSTARSGPQRFIPRERRRDMNLARVRRCWVTCTSCPQRLELAQIFTGDLQL